MVPAPPRPPEPLIFLHVPKTAGSTLRAVILRQYVGQPGFGFDGSPRDRERYVQFEQAERDAFQLIEGHLYYGVHELLSRPATYITMLREPVDRVLSLYYFIRRTPVHYMQEWFRQDPSRGLADVIGAGRTPEFDNFQTRLLAGGASVKVRFGNVTPAMLDDAKAHARDGFAVVGLTERFDESLMLLRHAFGWDDLIYTKYKVSEGRPRRSDHDPALIRLVEEANRFDVELYAFARTLFEQRVAAMGPSLAADLERFREAQRRHEASGPPAREPRLADGVWRLPRPPERRVPPGLTPL